MAFFCLRWHLAVIVHDKNGVQVQQRMKTSLGLGIFFISKFSFYRVYPNARAKAWLTYLSMLL